jgi:hypothetical protein
VKYADQRQNGTISGIRDRGAVAHSLSRGTPNTRRAPAPVAQVRNRGDTNCGTRRSKVMRYGRRHCHHTDRPLLIIYTSACGNPPEDSQPIMGVTGGFGCRCTFTSSHEAVPPSVAPTPASPYRPGRIGQETWRGTFGSNSACCATWAPNSPVASPVTLRRTHPR